MTTLFSKPKVPDTSAQQAAIAKREELLEAQETETKRREASAISARRRRARSSLITGDETGVLRQTLG